MRVNGSLLLIVIAMGLSPLLLSPAQASDESCINCHLHSEFTKDFTASDHKIKTLAGFHGQVFKRRGFKQSDSDAGCQACHQSRQTIGKLPSSKVCLGCHTRGKSAQGDPDTVFHAEQKHWPMDKVSCTTCHQGHAPGNPVIKFLTANAINACQQCHKKSFGSVTGSEIKRSETSSTTDASLPNNEFDNRYGQN